MLYNVRLGQILLYCAGLAEVRNVVFPVIVRESPERRLWVREQPVDLFFRARICGPGCVKSISDI